MQLPAEIYSVASVRRMDAAAMGDPGIGEYTLMMRAGQAAFATAVDVWPAARRWQVICGSGNNAGDAYVIAMLAAERGIEVSVIALSPGKDLSGDAATAYAEFVARGGVADAFDGLLDAQADLLVDGLLGTGIARKVAGRFAQVVKAMNAHSAPVLSLDIPSGIHGDSGAIMGVAVKATTTAVFVGLKSGLFLDSGPDHVGKLRFFDLEIAEKYRRAEEPVMRRIDSDETRAALPPRPRNAHKGDFGHILVVGGGKGMPGAARICAEAALRSGAGLVSVATHASHVAASSEGRPELMCHAVESAADLADLFARADVIAVGPGLGSDAWAKTMFKAVLDCDLPMVVDADALNLLAGSKRQRDNWILTPHPGEAGRLLDTTTQQIQADRRAALLAIKERYGGTVILKGSGTLVSSQDDSPWFCCAGNPGMASPGMGDALAGIVAALLGQGLSQQQAAVVGTQIHAEAGDAAAAAGERGMIVSDLIAQIRRGVNP